MPRARTPWSIKQRDDAGKVWQIVVDVPREPGEPRRQKADTVRGTRAQAERRAPRFLEEVRSEAGRSNPTRQTVSDYLEEWLETAIRPNLRPGSVRSYSISVGRLNPHIGDIPLCALKPLDIERAYIALRKAGLSGSTIRLTHSHFSTALRRAVAWGLIPHSPIDGVTAPQADPKPRKTLTQDQARQLLDAIKKHPSAVRLILGLSMGLRAGEVMALRWADIDMGALAEHKPCMATIRHSFCQVAQDYGPTKTGKERRVAIPEVAAEILREEVRRQVAHKAKDPEWNPDGLVACGERGRPGYHHMAAAVRALCVRLGIPQIVFHELRHTIGSLRVESGENPARVADELGHDRAVLLRTYAHVPEDQLIEGARRVDGLLAG